MIQLTPQAVPATKRTCASPPSVVEIAQQRFRECPYAALRRVKCRYHEGVLILTGTVPTFYMKQMAQTLMRRLDRVESIDNRLVVSSSAKAHRGGPEKAR